jgi:general secretion pathway protein E
MSAAEVRPTIDWAVVRSARARGETTILALAAQIGAHERVAAAMLAEHFHIPFLTSDDLNAYAPQFDKLSLAAAQQRRCVLLRDPARPQELRCALSDPFDTDLMAFVDSLSDQPISFCLATAADIHAYLNRHEAQSRTFDSLENSLGETTDVPQAAEVLSLATVSTAVSPAVRLVNSTLYDALRAGASDVHLESTPVGLAVKYRIDGVLDGVAQVNGVALAEHVISRLKVLAQLDIAERRIPQDGSFRVRAQEREIDLRVSIMPSAHGEDAVIRILDKQAMLSEHGQLTLDTLGFDARALIVIRELIEAPYGMLLVTGPTGSGKTTTLYAALSETHTGRDKVITIEDPVEYQLPGILQIPVNEKKGLTFARGLRSILRHDPDKIMVGEIRDRETAEIAVQSALTGHLVLSSVHANSVYDVFGRFTHMGLDPYALASALNGVWAQRLLRVNCQSCAKPHTPQLEELARVGLSVQDVPAYRFARGSGCGDCRGTGYRGRVAVAEVLRLTDELRELIVDKQPVRKIKELASRNGTRSLKDASLDLVAAGRTTLEEVRRVTLAS